MNKKLPDDAFSHYFASGAGRSYEATAKYCNMSERAIFDAAQREGWKERIAGLEKKARERVDAKAVETLAEMDERQLKELTLVEVRAIERLKASGFDSSMDAARALVMSIEKQRLIRGEPTDRTENVLETYRRDFERWMSPVEPEPSAQDAGEPQPSAETPAPTGEGASLEGSNGEASGPPKEEPRADEPGTPV